MTINHAKTNELLNTAAKSCARPIKDGRLSVGVASKRPYSPNPAFSALAVKDDGSMRWCRLSANRL